jgi:TetR/AcrR family transcriptional regulator, transcriptional repressor for nem operon
VEDLVLATGVGRGSLYGTFGDKEQLFRRVVSHYIEDWRRDKDLVTQGLTSRAALEAFTHSRLTAASRNQTPPGCFLQMVATTGTSAPLVQEALDATNREMTNFLREVLRQAETQGDLKEGADLDALAAMLGVFLAGLTASAKAGVPTLALSDVARHAFDLVFQK